MFSKAKRLSRAEFTHFFKIGQRIQHPALTLIFAPSEMTKISSVVGKKVARLAVKRNLLRRRLYAGIKAFIHDHKTTKTYILIAKPPFALLTRKEQYNVIEDLLARTLHSR